MQPSPIVIASKCPRRARRRRCAVTSPAPCTFPKSVRSSRLLAAVIIERCAGCRGELRPSGARAAGRDHRGTHARSPREADRAAALSPTVRNQNGLAVAWQLLWPPAAHEEHRPEPTGNDHWRVCTRPLLPSAERHIVDITKYRTRGCQAGDLVDTSVISGFIARLTTTGSRLSMSSI